MKGILSTFVYAGALIAMFVCGAFAYSQGWISMLLGVGGMSTNVSSILQSVEELSTLTTTRYTYTNQFRVYRDMPAVIAVLYGQEMTLHASGHVTAGVNLGALTENDIQISGGTLTVMLPAPTLQDCFFDETTSEILGERRSIFTVAPEQLQISARRIVISNFRTSALEQGILTEAKAQAEEAVQNFLELATQGRFTTIRVIAAPPNLAPTLEQLPQTCRL